MQSTETKLELGFYKSSNTYQFSRSEKHIRVHPRITASATTIICTEKRNMMVIGKRLCSLWSLVYLWNNFHKIAVWWQRRKLGYQIFQKDGTNRTNESSRSSYTERLHKYSENQLKLSMKTFGNSIDLNKVVKGYPNVNFQHPDNYPDNPDVLERIIRMSICNIHPDDFDRGQPDDDI